jgi:hypothetical protein
MEFAIARPRFFQGEPLPEGAELVGWAALVDALGVQAPLRRRSCVSEKHIRGSRRSERGWTIYDKRYRPEGSLAGHLNFALRREEIDLLVLKRLFDALPVEALAAALRAAPSGAGSRRAWFFYEMLTGRTLDLADAPKVAAVPALDPKTHFTAPGKVSTRHRVRDNLLGTGAFCPIIRRTPALEGFLALDLAAKAKDIIGRTGAGLIARAASFMLLADSRASFEIEGERAPSTRLERWGRAVLEAGTRPLTEAEITRLHRLLIGDDRFTEIGYRSEGVFLGERDHNNDPLPEFIGARPADLPALMAGLIECNGRLRSSDLDPVLQAAAIAFGFVYVHPLADGNGRLHRCLIHHVLAERGFTPPGMVFPVSSVMLERIEAYRATLQGHSGPLMAFIEWRALANGNLEVSNDTGDLYRFFDCTAEAEFLYGCVQRTVEQDLPQEIDYLKCHDQALGAIMERVEMPDRLAGDLIRFIRQNAGQLGKRRRERDFAKLTDGEVAAIEAVVGEAFEGFEEPGAPAG